MKTAIVFWSGTGNTEQMAKLIALGVRDVGGEAELFSAVDFQPPMVGSYDALAFGCSSQGSEELEDTVFAPMFHACEPLLAGKRIALFGSYGWGDGEWMRIWEARCREAGITLCAESVICCEAPDGDAEAKCKALGASLVS